MSHALKRALVTDGTAVWLTCTCGMKHEMSDAPEETRCVCGIVYNPRGWVIEHPDVERHRNDQMAKLAELSRLQNTEPGTK